MILNKDCLKRKKDLNKDEVKATIEDYIDSLIIAMSTTEEYIKNMTIRKFWRYIKTPSNFMEDIQLLKQVNVAEWLHLKNQLNTG